MVYTLCAFAGLLIGGVVAWLLAATRLYKSLRDKAEESERRANQAEGSVRALEATVAELRIQNNKSSDEVMKLREQLAEEKSARIKAETQLEETRQRLEEEKKLLEDAKAKLTDTFKAVAGDTLNQSTSQFLRLAKETLDKALSEARGDMGTRQKEIEGLIKPLAESILKFEEHVRTIEKNRHEAYSQLLEQLRQLTSTQEQLQKETANLVTALRNPQVRGRWGELTLKRVVELAGMSNHCDFVEQVTVQSTDGRLRPDLIVHLPSRRQIVVDAKVPLQAYLDAIAAVGEEERSQALNRHAKQVRAHMKALSEREYWAQFDEMPEFAVLFIPGESFFSAALEVDRSLIEDGLAQRVVIATPTTLIALLRAVAYGWRQEQIAENAQKISNLGKTIYERFRTLTDHINSIGKGLKNANEAYNRAVGSLESRLWPAAREFKTLGAGTQNDIAALSPVDISPREMAEQSYSESESCD
jgi:DNA recombination protein RmuC